MTPQEKVNKLDINKIVAKYLNYTFADIDWQYENLTTVERAIMSKEEFNLLKEVYHSDNECYAKPKQETLEDAAEKYDADYIDYVYDAFIEGAKWQAKKMYSEGEVENILIEYVKTNPTKPVSWFNQFKKK